MGTVTSLDGTPLHNCPSCGLLCPAARGWGRCPEAGFEVLTERLPEFEKAFAALVKRAGKLGCAPPSFAITTEYTRVKWQTTPDGMLKTPRRTAGGDRVSLVRVLGKAPSFGGWTLIAALTPIALPEQGSVNLIKSVPEAGELAESFRTSGTVCDHCRADRDRKETFVVRHEDGRTAQVGRQCVRDFLGGSSPEHVAAIFTYWKTASEMGEEGEGGGWGRRTDSESLIAYLGLVVREVRENGWLGRKTARESFPPRLATADLAWERMHPSPLSGRRPEAADEQEIALATSAVAWACASTETSDYAHNLRAIALSGSVEPGTLGLAASAWVAYEKACDREVERRRAAEHQAAKGPSEWQGKVDASTGVLFLTVLKVLDLESEFGVVHLHILEDDHGNAFKWFASAERLDPGTLYRIEGKVKKHDEFKGTKATVLTRCSATDPYLANVALSPAMQKLCPQATANLRPVVGDVFRGNGDTLRAARNAFGGVKGRSAEKAIQRLDAAIATLHGEAAPRGLHGSPQLSLGELSS